MFIIKKQILFNSESGHFWSVISERRRSRDISLKIFREIGIHEDYMGDVGDSSLRDSSWHQTISLPSNLNWSWVMIRVLVNLAIFKPFLSLRWILFPKMEMISSIHRHFCHVNSTYNFFCYDITLLLLQEKLAPTK